MKRAVLVSGDFVLTGGMDMPNFALARHLAERGISVQVVAHRIATELSAHANVSWHRVPKPLGSYFLGAPLLDWLGRRVAGTEGPPETRVLVNGGNCQVGDVNWVHYVHAAYEPERRGTVPNRAKAFLDRQNGLKKERSAVQMAQLVIANSERTRRDLTTLLDIDDSRIRTVYYGIDSTRFSPATESRRERLREKFGWPNRPQVAFIGALGDRRKGFDTLYAAWTTLCSEDSWDCDLVVVGRGAELPAWKARSEAAGLGKRIRFLGFRDDVPDILAACDAFVAPTRYEAYGLGVQEALCSGLPALVSADAGVAERYPAELQGLLLRDVNSPIEIEARLKAWRAHAEPTRELVTQFSAMLRQRSWDDMASEIFALLRQQP